MAKRSSEHSRLILIKSHLEARSSKELYSDLEHIAEQTIGGASISINQLDDGLRALFGEVAGEFVLDMVCQLDATSLDELASLCGLDEGIQKCLRQFVARYGARLEAHIRGKVLCGWRPWFRIDPRGHKDYEIHLSTIDGHHFHCQMDRRRAWELIGEILACLAQADELPEGLKPEIIQRFVPLGESQREG